MPLDYSEVTIGPPTMVIDKLTKRIGELNFSSQNIRIGVTTAPASTFRFLNHKLKWAAMKLVYATQSPAQAGQVAKMLRAWDAKLYVDTKDQAADSYGNAHYYAFVVTR